MPGGFNPNAAYTQIGTDTGQIIYLQGGTYFDINGNVVNAPLPSYPPGSPNVTYVFDVNGNPIGLATGSGVTISIANTYTWAQLQALTGQTAGNRAYVSDLNYAEFIYNGTIWTRATPLQLLGSGIPFAYQTSCSIGAATAGSSAITGLTSLGALVSYPYPCYTYWTGASATSAGLVSGSWYYTIITAATTATLYNNIYTGGTPSIPASPDNFPSLAGGSYTQSVASGITGPYAVVPANMLGLNGMLRYWANQLVTNACTSYMGYGSTNSNVMASGYLTTGEIGFSLREMRNRGQTGKQIVRNSSAGNSIDTNGNTSNTYLSIDSTAAQNASFALQPGAVTTWQILEEYTIEAWLGS